MANEKGKLLAVIRVRGYFGMNPKRRDTLEMLNIPRANNCTLVHENASYKGMLHEVKDYATWGEVSEKTLSAMLMKRGMKDGNRLKIDEKKAQEMAKELLAGKKLADIGVDRTFRLTPPSKGWKDKKSSLPMGDLGARKDIDVLLAKMI